MNWDVHVIRAGEFGRCPEWMCIRKEGVDPGTDIPSYIYLIENGKTNILVDASFSSVAELKIHSPDMYCKREREISEWLADFGLTPEDVNVLVLTHLHWDHAGTFLEYPNARVICQKAEYNWMRNTYQWEIGYPEWFAKKLLEHEERFELIEGDLELLPGVSLIICPGHTTGSQMVLIETIDGPVLIPGDNIMSYENLERGIPVGLFCNIDECLRALSFVAKHRAKCLPSHDWQAAERSSL